MNQSTLKTKMRRAGFRISKSYGCAWRKYWKYCERNGRKFRVRFNDGFVDVGEVHATFDRWANSTETVLTIEEFAERYLK